jgi:RNA polymerase sigma-B factor
VFASPQPPAGESFRFQNLAGVVSISTVLARTHASGVLVMELGIGNRHPSRELRIAHARRSRDPSERAALIEEFMPLAISLARSFRTNKDSRDDLDQVACVGLVTAFDRFDPERGLMFATFAVPTILGELRRHLRDRTWRLHVPRGVRELSVALDRVAGTLSAELGRSATIDELAGRMGVSPEAICEARHAADCQCGHSLDEPAYADARESLAETLGGADRELARAERVVVLDSWLAALPARQREVLRLRFEEDLTQREIAELLGLSQVHVSRLVRRSLEHLQAIAAQDKERSLLVA